MNTWIVPDAVAKRAMASGEEAKTWLERIDGLVASLQEEWHIRVGKPFTGGTDAFVAPAIAADGTACVLRLCIPDASALHDMLQADAAMAVADGRGYARLLREDPDRLACLMERLGEPLAALELPVEKQIDLVCETLASAWLPLAEVEKDPTHASLLPSGSGAVDWFKDFLPGAWERTGRCVSRQALENAMRCLDACAARLASSEPVLVHGDANASNCLRDPLRPGAFRFIDPDGALSEKAADLGVVMIAAPEAYRGDPLRAGIERCLRLHELTGVAPDAIWQWGCIQSVSTSMVCAEIAHSAGPSLMRIAEAWNAAKPF